MAQSVAMADDEERRGNTQHSTRNRLADQALNRVNNISMFFIYLIFRGKERKRLRERTPVPISRHAKDQIRTAGQDTVGGGRVST